MYYGSDVLFPEIIMCLDRNIDFGAAVLGRELKALWIRHDELVLEALAAARGSPERHRLDGAHNEIFDRAIDLRDRICAMPIRDAADIAAVALARYHRAGLAIDLDVGNEADKIDFYMFARLAVWCAKEGVELREFASDNVISAVHAE